MKTIQALFIALILCVSAVAQGNSGYVFKVLANKGNSQVKSGSEMTWKQIKTGAILNDGDLVKITEGSYLGLVHASGRTVELTTPGDVDINDLAAGLRETKASATSKYADFVLNKLSEAEEARKNELTVTGAVDRASEEFPINVVMPLTSEVYNPNARIQWNEMEGAPTYEVTVTNVFDEVVMSQLTSDNSLEINLNQSELAKERLLILSVSVKGDDKVKSESYGIKRLSGEEREAVKAKVEALANGRSASSLSEIMKAGLFEQHNLLVDAAASYQKAIELSPQVNDFQKMYDAFKDRNNLK